MGLQYTKFAKLKNPTWVRSFIWRSTKYCASHIKALKGIAYFALIMISRFNKHILRFNFIVIKNKIVKMDSTSA